MAIVPLKYRNAVRYSAYHFFALEWGDKWTIWSERVESRWDHIALINFAIHFEGEVCFQFICNIEHHFKIQLSKTGPVYISQDANNSKVLSHREQAIVLTHWGRDKMDAISQTTFSNAFSWMKMFECRLKFHWSLFLRVQLTISQHWFR